MAACSNILNCYLTINFQKEKIPESKTCICLRLLVHINQGPSKNVIKLTSQPPLIKYLFLKTSKKTGYYPSFSNFFPISWTTTTTKCYFMQTTSLISSENHFFIYFRPSLFLLLVLFLFFHSLLTGLPFSLSSLRTVSLILQIILPNEAYALIFSFRYKESG